MTQDPKAEPKVIRVICSSLHRQRPHSIPNHPVLEEWPYDVTALLGFNVTDGSGFIKSSI
jgi:hypothetical protein